MPSSTIVIVDDLHRLQSEFAVTIEGNKLDCEFDLVFHFFADEEREKN